MFSKVQGKLELEVEQLDGGLNNKDAPNKIGDFESPDCLNVVFNDDGSVQTRSGTTYLGGSVNTSAVDGSISYNGTAAIIAGGRMYRFSATTWAQITTASGKFASGANVEAVTFQGISFMSDGTNGPYRWEGGESFYNMGIAIPTAVTAVSGNPTAVSVGMVAGPLFYKVAFVNSHVVTGGPSTSFAGPVLTTTANVNVSSIPVGSGLNGVAARKIYRATSISGTYGLVKTLNDNTTTSFIDSVPLGSEGSAAVVDGTAPTPWHAVVQHKETLFFDDSTVRSFLRFTDYQNPYVSKAGNFFSVENNTGENIAAIGVQDDFVSVFYEKSKIWVYDLTDPSDPATWSRTLSPANLGIVGPKALAQIPNGIIFVGMLNGKLSGIHLLSGVEVTQTADDKLRSNNIAEKIEPLLFAMAPSLLSKIALTAFQNRVYFAIPKDSASTNLDGVLYFDILRLGRKGSPGSWAPWTGIQVQKWLVHNGDLYGGSSQADGRFIQLNSGTLTDANGSAINSYWWSKEFGGEGDLAYWTKDGRYIDLWYALLGSYAMKYRYRKDGEAGGGSQYNVDLTPGGAVWGAFTWGDGTLYSAGNQNKQSRVFIGPVIGKRFQHGFTNQNTVEQSFKIYSLQSTMNLRSQKRGG